MGGRGTATPGRRAGAALVAGLALALSLAAPVAALAEGGEGPGGTSAAEPQVAQGGTPADGDTYTDAQGRTWVYVREDQATDSTDGSGNGVQSQGAGGPDLQQLASTPEGDGTWGDSDAESPDAGDFYQDGKVHVLYNTWRGRWVDRGGGGHRNGTYVVTIPTKIAYDNMGVGAVSTSDDYTVNVTGVIGASQAVVLAAETGNPLANGSVAGEIVETTRQGRTLWTPSETFGGQADDGSLTGTDSTDNISLSGFVTTAGVYEGTVAYTAALVERTAQ